MATRKPVDFFERRLMTQIIIVFQRWMSEKDISLGQAADVVGMQPSALSRLLSGKTNMTMKSAGRLLHAAEYIPLITKDVSEK